MSSDKQERELGWDDEITEDGSDFVLAPIGDYEFEVTYMERCRHTPQPGGNGKLPECPKAKLSLRIHVDGEPCTIKHNLFLHSRCEGLVSAFLRAVGRKKHGEPARPEWSSIIGTRGRCVIDIRTWEGKNGEEMKSNEVKKFYDFDETKADASFETDNF